MQVVANHGRRSLCLRWKVGNYNGVAKGEGGGRSSGPFIYLYWVSVMAVAESMG